MLTYGDPRLLKIFWIGSWTVIILSLKMLIVRKEIFLHDPNEALYFYIEKNLKHQWFMVLLYLVVYNVLCLVVCPSHPSFWLNLSMITTRSMSLCELLY